MWCLSSLRIWKSATSFHLIPSLFVINSHLNPLPFTMVISSALRALYRAEAASISVYHAFKSWMVLQLNLLAALSKWAWTAVSHIAVHTTSFHGARSTLLTVSAAVKNHIQNIVLYSSIPNLATIDFYYPTHSYFYMQRITDFPDTPWVWNVHILWQCLRNWFSRRL